MNREDLFDKYLQRSLSREEVADLKALLGTDPEAGRALVEHINEASLICRVGSRIGSLPKQPAELVELPVRRTARVWKWTALAAALVALALLGWRLFPATPSPSAAIAFVAGDAFVERAGKSFPAESGLRLLQEDVVRTSPQSKVAVVFEGEATRAELLGGARARFSRSRHGKRIELLEGALEAIVAPQPKGQPMTLTTLHAEAKVLGTRLLLSSEVSSTRLEVSDGVVEFRRRSDASALLVRNGFTATASPNIEFSVRPFLPEPWASRDIGAVRLQGQARFDGSTFRIRGAGQDTCCKKDQLHFVYQTLAGDAEIQACVREIEFTDPEAKASLIIRDTLKSASPQGSLGITASGRLEFEHRTHNESRIDKAGWAAAPCWLKLVRRGNDLSAYRSGDGVEWTLVGSQSVPFSGRVYVGMGVTSFNHAALSASVFGDVRVASSNGSAVSKR